jgi:hypothetical protein
MSPNFAQDTFNDKTNRMNNRTTRLSYTLFVMAFGMLAYASGAPLVSVPAVGPLRVLKSNPRYFTDGSGKVVFLTGSHTWDNLQDYVYSSRPSPSPFDFGAYLSFLVRNNHNFFRLWAWESPLNRNAAKGTTIYDPMPYRRTGPGLAVDGKPKFDLSQFNQTYFDRMRARVEAARERGIYVSVMLFQGFSIGGKGIDAGDPWWAHPLNPTNNINGLDGGGSQFVHTLTNPAVLAVQENYVRKVIDTVNDMDNVLYEISNEDTGSAADSEWQIHMIKYIKTYEATKPKQHPVGMTVQYPESDDKILFESPADWISTSAILPRSSGKKVIINDTDHSFYWTLLRAKGQDEQRAWVWENLMQGNQCLFMDPYLDPSHNPGRNNPLRGRPDTYWDVIRKAMGQSRVYALHINLAQMIPHGDLASTGFCLANPGIEYVVFQPQDKREFTLSLADATGMLSAEWYSISKSTVISTTTVYGGGLKQFIAPFDGQSLLYIKK